MVGKEKYFQILGIKPTADFNMIKKAYRKQALRYHPDRNSSADAHHIFIQITEAYEVLTNQKKINTNTGETYKPKSAEEALAEKVAAAKERWQKQQEEEARKDRAYYQRIAFGWKWRIFQAFACYSAIFSILLVADFYLDGQQVSYTINNRDVRLDYYGKNIVVEEDIFHVDNNYFWYDSQRNLPLRANYSYLFGDLKSISLMLTPLPKYRRSSHSAARMRKHIHFEGKEMYSVMSFNSIYGVYPIVHFMFLVPFFLMIWKRPNLRFSVWRLISLWMIYPTVAFFTFNNNRIFNLIELILEG
jgi:DnaJ domain